MDTFDEIHLAVKNNNISYAEIAENIGISREHLSRQLSKKELSKKNTNKILDYLKSQKIDISTEIDNHTPTSTIKTNLGVQVYDVDFSAGKIKNLDWIFFSSKHAIDFFIQKIDQSILKNTKIAVLGLGTAAHLNKYQIQADFVGDGLGRTTAKLFENIIDNNVHVLFPCATQSLYQVQRHFTNNKINIENLAVYENAMIENVPKSDAAILVFTSPMNVRAYFSTHQIDATQKVISIGKTTSEVLSEFAVQHQVAYAPYNYCLVDEIMSL